MADYRYDRKIRYIDYIVNGERQYGAGFIKLEQRGGSCHFLMRIGGVRMGGSLLCPVCLCTAGEERPVAEVTLRNGQGDLERKYMDQEHLFQTDISYDDILAIRIPVAAGRELYCRVAEERNVEPESGLLPEGGEGNRTVREEAGYVQMPGGVEGNRTARVETGYLQMPEAGRGDVLLSAEAGYVQMPKAEEGNRTARGETGYLQMPEAGRADVLSSAEAGYVQMPEAEEGNRTARGEAGYLQMPEAGRGDVLSSAEAGRGDVLLSAEAGYVQMPKAEEGNRTARGETGYLQMPDGRNNRLTSMEGYAPEAENISAGRADTRQMTAAEKTDGKREAQGNAAETDDEQEPAAGKGKEAAPVQMLEDKWKQICAVYPHSFPFQDEREYLTLGPSDFVILSEASYRLVNNSFLLHGYYNYHHLILTRLLKRGEYRYYIGVPGNYYEREKQVAVMFGFEIFECRKEPAQEGDFGYYLIPVSL